MGLQDYNPSKRINKPAMSSTTKKSTLSRSFNPSRKLDLSTSKAPKSTGFARTQGGGPSTGLNTAGARAALNKGAAGNAAKPPAQPKAVGSRPGTSPGTGSKPKADPTAAMRARNAAPRTSFSQMGSAGSKNPRQSPTAGNLKKAKGPGIQRGSDGRFT